MYPAYDLTVFYTVKSWVKGQMLNICTINYKTTPVKITNKIINF